MYFIETWHRNYMILYFLYDSYDKLFSVKWQHSKFKELNNSQGLIFLGFYLTIDNLLSSNTCNALDESGEKYFAQRNNNKYMIPIWKFESVFLFRVKRKSKKPF